MNARLSSANRSLGVCPRTARVRRRRQLGDAVDGALDQCARQAVTDRGRAGRCGCTARSPRRAVGSGGSDETLGSGQTDRRCPSPPSCGSTAATTGRRSANGTDKFYCPLGEITGRATRRRSALEEPAHAPGIGRPRRFPAFISARISVPALLMCPRLRRGRRLPIRRRGPPVRWVSAGHQRAVRPGDVGEAAFESLAVLRAPPRRVGCKVEVALADL